MPKYRKKPIVIEAVQWFPWPQDGHEYHDAVVFGWSDAQIDPPEEGERGIGYGYISTLEGRMRVSPGDWIITGVNGERYPCKPDIFNATYEAVDDDSSGTEASN